MKQSSKNITATIKNNKKMQSYVEFLEQTRDSGRPVEIPFFIGEKNKDGFDIPTYVCCIDKANAIRMIKVMEYLSGKTLKRLSDEAIETHTNND